MDICYLCNKNILEDGTDEHVPPKQFFPKAWRIRENPQLLTLRAHEECNKSYKHDEDYFFHSIAPLAKDATDTSDLWDDVRRRISNPNNHKLAQMVLREFDAQPSGVILPFGKVKKTFDKARFDRVIWKIARGIHSQELNQFMPENTPLFIEILDSEEPGELWHYVLSKPSKGSYPEIFDYKFTVVPEVENMRAWAFIFWSFLIVCVASHEPNEARNIN